MAAYLTQSDGQTAAALVYGGSFLVMAVTFGALNRQILLRRSHMLVRELPLEEREGILRRSLRGIPYYAVATALALVSAYITLGMCAALAIYYALPIASTPDAVSSP
jgi:hypothetical protein